MPESVVREELEALGIHVQGVLQLRSGRLDQDASKDRPLTPLHYISGTRARGVQGAIYHRTLRSASVGGDVRGSKGPVAMQALPTLQPHAAQMRIRAPVRSLWWLPTLRCVLNPAGTASVLWLRGKPHS